MLWEIAAREQAWASLSNSMWRVIQLTLDNERPHLPPAPGCADWLVELICKCWASDPEKRPEFSEIFETLATHIPEYALRKHPSFAALRKSKEAAPSSEQST